jgi:branched-chain amino acid transport system substrate-binding protein
MTHYRFALSPLFILLAAALGSQVPAAEKSIKIGVQLPLSGERAAVGRTIKQGVEMAVETLNREGGVNGVPLTVIYEDDQNTKQGAVDSLGRLILDHQVVAVIGELFSPFVLASRDLAEQTGVPYLTGGTSPKTTQTTKWVFRVGASDTLLADLIARYVVEHLNLKQVAVLHDRTGIHNARAELVVRTLQAKYGVVPLVQASWKPGDQDFTPELEQVKARPVEAIIALGETDEGGPLLRQVKERGIRAPVIAHRDFGAQTVIQAAGGAAEGVVIITEYMPMVQERERQAWAGAYQQRYGAEASVIAAQYYDAVLLIAEAIRKGGPDREGIKAGLEQLKGFRGVMADYTFDQQHNGVHRFHVVKIKGGKPTLETLLEEAVR